MKRIALIFALALPAMAQQITLGTQTKGVLPTTQGGFGINAGSATGCPSFASGSVTINSGNCSGGSPSGAILSSPGAGQTVTQPTGTTLAVNSLNKQAFADQFAGADIGAKINAAYASMAGTSSGAGAAASALVNLSPGQIYLFGTTIVIPNQAVFPYIYKPMLDCHGSHLRWNGASGSSMILVLGENARDPFSTLDFRNCVIDAGGISMPSLVQIRGRLGFGFANNIFEGSGTTTACVSLLNTNDSGGPGYTEGWAFESNGWNGCTEDIAMHRGAGGTDSMDYGWLLVNHWQLGGGQIGLHIYGDEGFGPLNVQGGHISGTTNTAGGGSPAKTVLIDSGSVMLSAYVDLGGEDTGGNGFYDVYGASSMTGSIHSRGSLGITSGSVLSPALAIYPGKSGSVTSGSMWRTENAPAGIQEVQSVIAANGQYFDFWGAAYGTEGFTHFQLHNCLTGPGDKNVFSPTVRCTSPMYWNAGYPVLSGVGWGEIGSGALTYARPSGPYGSPDWAFHGVEVVAPATGTASSYGVTGQTDGTIVEWANSAALKVAIPGSVSPTNTFTGSCSAGASSTVVNGRVTSCAAGSASSVQSLYANIPSTLFALNTMLGPVYFEPSTLASVAAKTWTVRLAGTISCTVAPAISLMDLGTSPTTSFGGASGSVYTLPTSTSAGVYASSGSVNMVPGHYYGYAITSGTCATPPTFDINTQLQ